MPINKRQIALTAVFVGYHATAVESNRHLIQCLVYIDLNMIRAGVVKHPSEWRFSGYNEFQAPRKRYSIIDYKSLIELLNFDNYDELINTHQKWVEASLKEKKEHVRENKWSQSIAVGSKKFIEKVKSQLGIRARGRSVKEAGNGSHQLKETQASYGDNPANTEIDLGTENTIPWNI